MRGGVAARLGAIGLEDDAQMKFQKTRRQKLPKWVSPRKRRRQRLTYGLTFTGLLAACLFMWSWSPFDAASPPLAPDATVLSPPSAPPETPDAIQAAPYRVASLDAIAVDGTASVPAYLAVMPAKEQIAAVAPAAMREAQRPQASPTPSEVTFSDTVRRGDTALMILERAGVDRPQAMAFYRGVRQVYDLRRIHAGHAYHVRLAPDGRIDEFTYEVDRDRRFLATRKGQDFSAALNVIPYERKERVVAGALSESLYADLRAQGESGRLIHDFVDIFAWSVDFATDLHPGDTFRLLIEERKREGEAAAYHRILAAELINKNRKLQAIYYQQGKSGAYYRPDGSSMKGMFLRSPLRYTRISSRFTKRRFHPVLKRYRPHFGVDYAAPRGTPVRSVADGVVIWAGRKGPNGNMVIVRHSNAYKTYYLHLSRYAPGLRRNKRVTQGQIIGYVGSTGRSTGPHLDFRLSKNGKYLNPLKHKSIEGPRVPKKALVAFRKQAGAMLNKLHQVQLALQHEGKSERPNSTP